LGRENPEELEVGSLKFEVRSGFPATWAFTLEIVVFRRLSVVS
jgi:hypothetical protein